MYSNFMLGFQIYNMSVCNETSATVIFNLMGGKENHKLISLYLSIIAQSFVCILHNYILPDGR